MQVCSAKHRETRQILLPQQKFDLSAAIYDSLCASFLHFSDHFYKIFSCTFLKNVLAEFIEDVLEKLVLVFLDWDDGGDSVLGELAFDVLFSHCGFGS